MRHDVNAVTQWGRVSSYHDFETWIFPHKGWTKVHSISPTGRIDFYPVGTVQDVSEGHPLRYGGGGGRSDVFSLVWDPEYMGLLCLDQPSTNQVWMDRESHFETHAFEPARARDRLRNAIASEEPAS